MNDKKELYFCRLCGSREFKFLVKNIITFLGEKYSLRQCLSCTFVSIYPLPDFETLSRYYISEYWQTPQHEKFGIVNKLFSFRMQPVLRDIKKLLTKGKRLLDWGSGDGEWVRVARQAGFEAWGIDQYQKNLNNEFIRNGDIESLEFPNEYFDVVTCFHVLEHLHNPVSNYKTVMRKLKPGGIMMIEVPNIDSFGFRLFRKKWQPLEIPTHLNHFSPKTLTDVILTYGECKIIKKRFFSFRASPASLVLSMFPQLNPRQIRASRNGQHPINLKIIYLFLQGLSVPFNAVGTFCKKGSMMQFVIKKNGQIIYQ